MLPSFSFIHIRANSLIRCAFEYLMAMAPTWSKKERLWSLCFDDMHLDPSANIDRIADELVGPARNGNLLVVGTHTYEVFSYLKTIIMISKSKIDNLKS